MLRLVDRHGAQLRCDPSLIESNPALWDLLYNGIRHSVAAGADIDRATRERLFLDPPEPSSVPCSDE